MSLYDIYEKIAAKNPAVPAAASEQKAGDLNPGNLDAPYTNGGGKAGKQKAGDLGPGSATGDNYYVSLNGSQPPGRQEGGFINRHAAPDGGERGSTGPDNEALSKAAADKTKVSKGSADSRQKGRPHLRNQGVSGAFTLTKDASYYDLGVAWALDTLSKEAEAPSPADFGGKKGLGTGSKAALIGTGALMAAGAGRMAYKKLKKGKGESEKNAELNWALQVIDANGLELNKEAAEVAGVPAPDLSPGAQGLSGKTKALGGAAILAGGAYGAKKLMDRRKAKKGQEKQAEIDWALQVVDANGLELNKEAMGGIKERFSEAKKSYSPKYEHIPGLPRIHPDTGVGGIRGVVGDMSGKERAAAGLIAAGGITAGAMATRKVMRHRKAKKEQEKKAEIDWALQVADANGFELVEA
jgi:hypothetical protein